MVLSLHYGCELQLAVGYAQPRGWSTGPCGAAKKGMDCFTCTTNLRQVHEAHLWGQTYYT